MFTNQKIRLLRGIPWKNATELAEELVAMFSDNAGPVQIPEGVQLNAANGVPIKVKGVTDDTPIAQFQLPNGSDVNVSFTGGQLSFTDKATGDPVPSSGGGGSGDSTPTAFAGTVVSGSGSSYQVSILVSGASQTVSVTQRQIDASETIPAGTSALVVKDGGNYYMQVPVWL